MRTGVVGLGLIGGSVLRGLGGAVGYDADPRVRAAAAAEGFAVVAELAGLADREVVIVAVPPGRTDGVVAAALDAAPAAVVADAASVKGVVLASVPERDRFVGAHPLAGAETAGWAASSADVLAGAVWAVCPAGESVEPVCRLGAAVDVLGGRLVACTAAEHDEAVARTSHVPHLAALSFALLIAGEPLHAALSGTAFRDMTRVARADAALWAEILSLNRDRSLVALDELAERLAALRGSVAAGDLTDAWAAGADALAAVDAARWSEPAWRDEGIEGGWAGLLALGRAGRAVRRLRADAAGALRAEVTR